jgi:hypothetical protein
MKAKAELYLWRVIPHKLCFYRYLVDGKRTSDKFGAENKVPVTRQYNNYPIHPIIKIETT